METRTQQTDRDKLIAAFAAIVKHERIRARLGLPTCKPCREAVLLSDLVTVAGWDLIVAAFRRLGKADPLFELTRIDWDYVGEDEDPDTLSLGPQLPDRLSKAGARPRNRARPPVRA